MLRMYIFSEVINSFIRRAQEILAEEKNKLDDKEQELIGKAGYYEHINIVVFDEKGILGRFVPFGRKDKPTICVAKRLMYEAKQRVLREVIQHELAHYIDWKQNNKSKQWAGGHTPQFKKICAKYGFISDEAKINVPKRNNELEGDLRSEELISKIKKLLTLGSSHNEYEAELAKANQLLLKHNLNFVSNKDHEEVYTSKVLSVGLKNSKYRSIVEILQKFNVYPVWCTKPGGRRHTVEVSGSRASVEIAEYVAKFLDAEFERLWKATRKEKCLYGLVAKNNFFRGLSDGFLSKIEDATEEVYKEQPESCTALAKIEGDLEVRAKMAYNGLRTARGLNGGCFDSGAYGSGYEVGKRLSIHKVVKSTNTKTFKIGR